MKVNGNNLNSGDYYIGLDIGTNSVGWAVTDKDYNVLRFKGNSMWGARLFEEASDASGRRTCRTARRRLARRKQRLLLLELLFAEEMQKIDPNFFIKLKESSLYPEDKTTNTNYSLSNQSSETLVFSRKIGILILVPYVFSLVFALMSRNKGNFLFRLPRPPYQAVLRKFVSLLS